MTSREAELEQALRDVLFGSLLDVRRAAFSPKIGCRYTEDIRADIANACASLEDRIKRELSNESPAGRREQP